MTLVETSWDDARAAAHNSGVVLPVEEIELGAGDRRVLARDVLASTSLPAFATSAMDGWAVSGDGPWRVVGQVLAGSIWRGELARGEAVRIATGAAIPMGTFGVLRREHGSLTNDTLSNDDVVSGVVEPGQDVRPAGEEAEVGDVLINSGTLMAPVHLGLAAAGGTDQLVVVSRPIAQVLVLGDELLDSGPSHDGQVRDSLGPQIPGWLARMGVLTRELTRVQDTRDAHVAAINNAAIDRTALGETGDVDLVVTTGGTAAGPVDHLHAAIAEVGGVLEVDSVAVRPGHPMLLARLGERRWLLGLPGNPQSAVVALLSLGGPLLAALNGQPLTELDRITLGEDVGAPANETRLVLSTRDSGIATTTGHLGSAMLRGLAHSDGFAVIPPGGLGRGSTARWLPLPR